MEITKLATKIACANGLLESRVQRALNIADNAFAMAQELNELDFGLTAYQDDAYGHAEKTCVAMIESILKSMNKMYLNYKTPYEIYISCIDSGENVSYVLTQLLKEEGI